MKYAKNLSLLMIASSLVSVFGSFLAWPADPTGEVSSAERDYLVKGMFCGGCAFGVKKALERSGLRKDQILDVDYSKPDPDHKIGHAKVKFDSGQYRGKESDCKIIKAIRDNPGYVAYLEPSNSDPCGLEKKEK